MTHDDTTHVGAGDPGTDADRYLDATMTAFLRYGVGRTRMVDVAAEARVSRTTAYRMLGSVERAGLSLLRRELEALLREVTRGFERADDRVEVIDVCARAMAYVEQHPLFRKIRHDEPGIIGESIVRETEFIVDTVTAALAPSFRELAIRGVLVVEDHGRLAEMLVRLGITCVLAPPAHGYQPLLSDLIQDNIHARSAGAAQRQ